MKNQCYNKDRTVVPYSGVDFLSKVQTDDRKGKLAEWFSAEVWLPELLN